MDPLAHTLFGATLAETGLKRLSRYATPTLLIGANLPDIDAVATAFGRDTSLYVDPGEVGRGSGFTQVEEGRDAVAP